MNKLTSIIGCLFCIAFLLGLATTLNKINDDWLLRRFASLHIDGLSNSNDVI